MLLQLKRKSLLLIMALVSVNCYACSGDDLGGDLAEPPHIKPEGPVKGEGVTRLVTYNILRFSYDKTQPGGNYETIAGMMKEIEADAVCLNEVDKNTGRSGGVYQLDRFARLMGSWDFMYGTAMPYDGGFYGEGVATKEKAVKKEEVPLPQGNGREPRVLVVMEMEDYIIMTTNLDHAVEEAHIGQVNALNAYIEENYGSYKKPIFLGGDLNARTNSPTIALLKEKWHIISVLQSTFPSHMPDRTLDYILASKNGAEFEGVGTQIPRDFKSGDVKTASDHLPVMVDVKLPPRRKSLCGFCGY